MRRALTLMAVVVVGTVACRTWRPITTNDEYQRAEAACAADDQLACGYVAESLREAHRYGRAFTLALASCDAGVGVGCACLGLFYTDGLGEVPQDVSRGIELLDFACTKGVSWGCADLGTTLIERDAPTAEELARAAAALERGCDGGSLMGCTNLGHMLTVLWEGHLDPKRARGLLLSACDAGSVASCRRAGLSLLDAEGGPVDPDAGYVLLEGACGRGDARACRTLGERDELEWATLPMATRYYRLACRADARFGCLGLANSLMIISDAGLDEWEGRDAAEKACAHDEGAGCGLFADFLLRGHLAPDPPRARMLAETSCDAGIGHGCLVRSRIDDGGLPWLRRAVDLGSQAPVPTFLSMLDGAERRLEAARLCDAGVDTACPLPDGGSW
ncbi:MAG: hypothetical protein Q8S33_27295 [Myxococcales bacterium]|nr:hypothetical protein [Myxococcales bacterium]